ncbi:MAG: DNA alkylation repair protein [Candidatus Paceibacterota bacterium]|jgi:3-methyladenine DNA glycosylase AlkD
MSYTTLIKELKAKENLLKAKILAGFFKTGKGQYGEGDLFLGITVPESRKIAQKYKDLKFNEIEKILQNKYHEVRLVAILILVHKYKQASTRQDLVEMKEIVNFYLKNTKYINNWDLVDLSAHYIIGDYLFNKDSRHNGVNKKILEKLAKSKNLWERRIAVISTFAFIYKGQSDWTFRIVKMLLNDSHDLIHKACGWMLREVGKRVSENELIGFLNTHGNDMPRTMLRYAIERLPEEKRKYYLKKTLVKNKV